MPKRKGETETKNIDAGSGINLNAYFERIDYKGPPEPTLETLKAVILHHTASIAFENLNPLLKWPVKLDLESLQQKIVFEKRGGYCFEQNLLLSHVLKAIGYEVRWLSARVLWNRPEGAVSPRTHMLLLLNLGYQSFITDVGFGGLTLTGPLKLITDEVQATPHEYFRLTKEAGDYILEANVQNDWKAMFSFSLQEQLLPDFEATSWYLCNHPQSHFIKTLRAALSAPGYRYALNNNEYAVHSLNGGTERKTLPNAEEIMKVLEDVFLIRLPDAPELKHIIESVIMQANER